MTLAQLGLVLWDDLAAPVIADAPERGRRGNILRPFSFIADKGPSCRRSAEHTVSPGIE